MDLAEWTKYDWLLQQSNYRCPITANCPIKTVQRAADAPFTFEEIVMVMIKNVIVA